MFGYIRETREMAIEASKKKPDQKYTGLEDYLKVLYPGVEWIHDKRFGLHGDKNYGIRPDYRSDDEMLIIEFDGLQHYTQPDKIKTDIDNQAIYESFGYKVIRIPYFIQITNEVAREMFGKKVDIKLFDPSLPSMGKEWKNTPAYCCTLGLKRMAKEYRRYPQQYKVNVEHLTTQDEEILTGVGLLIDAYNNCYANKDKKGELQKGG